MKKNTAEKKNSLRYLSTAASAVLLLCLILILVLRIRDEKAFTAPLSEETSAPEISAVSQPAEPSQLLHVPASTPEPTGEPVPEPERVYELPRLELNGVAPIKVDEYTRSGTLILTDEYGNEVCRDEELEWRTHGNSTARFGKLPIKLKLSREVDLLGMGKAKKYILLANAYDKTLIRNALAFDLGSELGMAYTSQYRFVDLYISGQYRGNYMLIEAVEIDRQRVNIHPAANEFLLEVFMGSYTPEGPSVTSSELGIRLEVFGDELSEEQRAWLESFLTEAEKALLGGDESAVREYFDMDSFIDHYIINELSKNSDCSFASSRFYIKNGKLYAGPLWDFDLSFGNGAEPADWRHYVNGTNPAPTDGWYAPVLWWKVFAGLDWFEAAFSARYEELQPIIVNLYEDNELGRNRIDRLISAMPESITKNYDNLWVVNVRSYAAERMANATYEETVEALRSWIRERNEWICAQIAAGGDIIRIEEES